MHIRFFVDSNITGYVYTFAANYFFFPSAAVLFRGRCNRANIARLQKFASVIKRTFRRYIRWIFKLLSWCDVCSIICFVKLNRRYRQIVLRKYLRVRACILFAHEFAHPYGEKKASRNRRFRDAFMGICSHIYIPLEKGKDSYCTRTVSGRPK